MGFRNITVALLRLLVTSPSLGVIACHAKLRSKKAGFAESRQEETLIIVN